MWNGGCYNTAHNLALQFLRVHAQVSLNSVPPSPVRCSFNGLGVKLSSPDDADSIEKLALVMFDTRTIKGLDFNPFSENNVLKLNSVQEYPQDLYFILRTVLMFRGMAQSLGVEFSIADKWAPHAQRLLASPP